MKNHSAEQRQEAKTGITPWMVLLLRVK